MRISTERASGRQPCPDKALIRLSLAAGHQFSTVAELNCRVFHQGAVLKDSKDSKDGKDGKDTKDWVSGQWSRLSQQSDCSEGPEGACDS